MTPLAIEWLFKFPPHPTSALQLPGQNRPNKSCVKINEKTSINSIYPDLWPPTASQLQGLTDIKQTTFKDVYEFKKWQMKPGLVWSRTLLILLSMNAESVSMPVFTQCTHISSIFAVGSWKTKQLDKLSTKVSRKLTKYVFVHYLDKAIILHWAKKQYFIGSVFPR